jgi:hypothetical protein
MTRQSPKINQIFIVRRTAKGKRFIDEKITIMNTPKTSGKTAAFRCCTIEREGVVNNG